MSKTTEKNISDNFIYNESILNGKIHESLEDPVSELFYTVSNIVSDHLFKIGFVPNIITTIKLLTITCLFVYTFQNNMFKLSAIIYLFVYFLDCLDGHFARKYNMETLIGEYYDFITNVITILISLYFVFNGISDDKKWINILISVLLIVSIVQIGCEEKYIYVTDIKSPSEPLTSLQCLCPLKSSNLENFMEISKFFGIGMYHLFISILIWNFDSLID